MQGIGFAIVAAAVYGVTVKRTSNYRSPRGMFRRWLCGILFACCALTFQLILCEVLQAGDHSIRERLWKVVTAILLVILGIVAPFVQIWRVVVENYPRLKLLAIVLYAGYLLLFRLVSQQLPIERYKDIKYSIENESQWFSLRQDSLACISFVGITTMALLCAVSSVTAPYTTFFSDRLAVTEVDTSRLERSLRSIDDLISSKELEISRLRLDLARHRTSATTNALESMNREPKTLTSPASSALLSTLPSFMSRLVRMVRSDDRQAELKGLLVEQEALYKLKVEISADLAAVQQRLEQQRYYKTARGFIHRIVFSIFSVYCIYRVLNSYVRMGWWLFRGQDDEGNRTGPKDAIVLLIASWINHAFPYMGVPGWTRIIGVVMSGAVLAAALNGVLQTSLRVLRRMHRTSSSAVSAIALDPLFVGQIVGIYVLSIATTLRFNLPRDMSGPIMAALVSPLKVSSVQLWNDTVLCLTSSVVLAVLLATSRFYEETYDDEMGGIKSQ